MRFARLVRYAPSLLLMVAFTAILGASERGIMIVNSDVPLDSLSGFQLGNIYLGRTELWGNGTKIQPSGLDTESDIADRFFRNLLDTSPDKYKRYWLKRVFSGYGAPPVTFRNPRQVVEFVADRPGGIGFIPESAFDSTQGIKAVVIDSSAAF